MPDPTYTVVPSDFNAMPPLIAAQNDLRQMLSTVPSATLADFMDQVDQLGRGLWPATSSQIQGWVADFLALLTNTTTASLPFLTSPTPVTGVYVACRFANWSNVNGRPGIDWPDPECFLFGGNTGRWVPPTESAAWVQSVTQITQQLGASDNSAWPPYLINAEFLNLLAFPGAWTDYANVPQGCNLWSEQSAALTALQGQTLTADACPFVLYLLLALTTSTAQDQALVETISNTPASSQELANANLAEQLVYFALMYLNNPVGPGWTHDQILSWVQALLAATPVNADSETLVQVLTQQEKILVASSDYPIDDPYNPSIGFTQRYNDTLAAIYLAWTPGGNS